jgi:hypothetical protein
MCRTCLRLRASIVVLLAQAEDGWPVQEIVRQETPLLRFGSDLRASLRLRTFLRMWLLSAREFSEPIDRQSNPSNTTSQLNRSRQAEHSQVMFSRLEFNGLVAKIRMANIETSQSPIG